jgi:dCTP deaminase
LLNDEEIEIAMDIGDIGIKPFNPVRVQPVSYDVTLSREIRVPRDDVTLIRTREWFDYDRDCTYYGHGVPSWHNHTTECEIGPQGYILRPGEFLLACTEEYVRLSPTIAAMVEGKSSLGRLGMTVHVTAGVIDPGFEGQITLEIANLAPWAIELHEGMPIAQLVFERVNRPQFDYSEKGRYQGQTGPTESRYRL